MGKAIVKFRKAQMREDYNWHDTFSLWGNNNLKKKTNILIFK